MSYLQRRESSGVYEFRKRLPQVLAGKPASVHLRDRFTALLLWPNTVITAREPVDCLGDLYQAKILHAMAAGSSSITRSKPYILCWRHHPGDATQRVKAIEDAITAHGLIGP